MKASIRTISLGLLMVLGLATYAIADEITESKHPAPAAEVPKAGTKTIPDDLNADLNLSLYSKYIWRGYELSKDSFVMFPTLTVGSKGFAVNLWGDLDTHFDVEDGMYKFRLQETDVTLTYSNSISKLNYSVGWILYNYHPAQNQEVFLTMQLDTFLKPIFCVYNEIEIGQAWYLMAGVSHSIALPKDMALEMAATASYMSNHGNAIAVNNISAFHDGNVSVDLKIPVNSYLSISPKVQYSFPLSGAARDRIQSQSFNGNASDWVYGGLVIDLAI